MRRVSRPLVWKLTAAFLAAAVLVCVVAAVCVNAIQEEAERSRILVQDELAMLADLADFQAVLQQKGMAALYLLTGEARWRQGVTRGRMEFEDWLQRARAHVDDGARRRVLDEMQVTYTAYDAARAEALAQHDRDDAPGAAASLATAQSLATTLLDQAREFARLGQDQTRLTLHHALEHTTELGWWLLLLACAAAAASLGWGFAVARSLTRPIYELQLKISNLTELARVEVADDESLEHMGANVAAVIGHLERTHAVLVEQRRRLLQTEKLSAMGELTAKLAHQVLNPLAGMKAAVQALARRKEVNAEQVQATAQALALEVTRVEELLRRMMEYARPLAPRPQLVTVGALLGGAVASARNALGEAMPPVEVSSDDGIPPLEVDPVLMAEALTNLVVNAAQVTPPGTSVQLAARLSEPGQVRLEVLDRGPGLSSEAQQQLFKPFFTTRPKGHGLGLAVSYNIALEHGGTLSAANRDDGAGAAFTLSLPLVR